MLVHVIVDPDACIGSAECVALDPESIELDEQGTARLRVAGPNIRNHRCVAINRSHTHTDIRQFLRHPQQQNAIVAASQCARKRRDHIDIRSKRRLNP